MPVPLRVSCYVTAGAQAQSRWAPAGPSGLRTNDLDGGGHWPILGPEAADQRDPGAGRRSVEAGGLVQAVADRKQAGMSLFQRAHDIVRAKANKALDAAERPDEMLDLSYEDMLDQITKVKQALVR